MAAAILMMNMQGAVMAADKDSTIFRYSDKVPFALMVNPNSKLPWADIWNEFRILNTFFHNMQILLLMKLFFAYTTSQEEYSRLPII